MVLWINAVGTETKNIKKQPFSDARASHLSLVLWHVWFQAGAWICHTTSPTPPSYEVGGIAKRIKTSRLRRKTKLQKSKFALDKIKKHQRAHHNVGTCLWHVSMHTVSAHMKHAKGMSLRYGVIVSGNLMDFLPRKYFIIRGFSPWNGERFLSLGQRGEPS